MKWIKRTAALAAALLLLSTAAYARMVYKAAASDNPAGLGVRMVSPQEEDRLTKMPVLMVASPDGAEPLPPEESDPPELTVAPPARSVAIPDPSLRVEAPEPPEADPVPEVKAEPVQVIEPVPAVRVEPERPIAADGPSFPEAEDWQILLVNPWNEMPEDYQITLKALSDGMKVDERIYDDLNAMLQACRDAGLRPKICSAYRTMSKQTYLYNNKISRLRSAGYSKAAAQEEAGRWVARPGTSEHQLGLALDIVSSSYQALTRKQEKTAEQKWLMEHCWEYGFILRYPNEKSEITGIGYEPWHYRYVGREVALDVRESGLCFEEYLLLREETLQKEA